MSEFKCEVVRVKIEPHPNADAIEIARVGDYQSIVKKGQLKDGDLAVYIPEQAVLPIWLLAEMGFWDVTRLKGNLSGSAGNRVKAIKLRGVLSQGLILPGNCGEDAMPDNVLISANRGNDLCPVYESASFDEGDDAAEFLGIVKYEPPIPSHMAGRIVGVDYSATHKYDFENLKKQPSLFDEGEPVVITEKIHGTLMCVGVVPTEAANEKYYGGRVIVTSKGMGAKGMVLDHNDETNLYAQAAKKHGLLDSVLAHLGPIADMKKKPAFVFGEVFGRTSSGAGVQDLTYSGETLDFCVFDACIGNRGGEEFMPFDGLTHFCVDAGLKTVPVLYIGPYSKDKVLELTDGNTTLGEGHIREGVVVKAIKENRHPRFGRKIAKSVSEAYLLRKGNTTEFQ